MEYFNRYGEMYDIQPELIMAIAYVESGFNPLARSSAGAIGICQQIPRCVQDMMDELGLTDLYDPEQSIHLCAYMMAKSRDKGYEVADALTIYNRGEYGAKPYLGTMTRYAEKVLDKAYEYERVNGK